MSESPNSIALADALQNGQNTSKEFGRMNGMVGPLLHVLSEAWRNEISGHTDLCLRFNAINPMYDIYTFDETAEYSFRAAVEMGLFVKFFTRIEGQVAKLKT